MKSRVIVLMGGFLSTKKIYTDMGDALSNHSGCQVKVVETRVPDWLLSTLKIGWMRLLDRLDQTVRSAWNESGMENVTLVGHSIGGVLARLYLSPEPFLGRSYNGLRHIDHLITLGSPHHNRGGWRRGGLLSRWVEDKYPGAFFSSSVRYTSVAGKWMSGDRDGPHMAAWVYDRYAEMIGDGTSWGDGMIPVQSALLAGSDQITLDGVSHYKIFDTSWYGSKEIIPKWWFEKAKN